VHPFPAEPFLLRCLAQREVIDCQGTCHYRIISPSMSGVSTVTGRIRHKVLLVVLADHSSHNSFPALSHPHHWQFRTFYAVSFSDWLSCTRQCHDVDPADWILDRWDFRICNMKRNRHRRSPTYQHHHSTVAVVVFPASASSGTFSGAVSSTVSLAV
jgi:hypothetical protein